MIYRLSPKAAEDVEAIGDHIAAHSPRAAVAFIERLHERWALLATQPNSGAFSHVVSNVRHVVTGNYVTFYRPDERGIVILRVIHGHRDMERETIE